MICNLTKKTVISSRTECAVGLWQRARGMIGRDFDCFDGVRSLQFDPYLFHVDPAGCDFCQP